MPPGARPQWQQATALLTLGASGVVTGLSLVPKTPADLTSPASLPIKLMALERSTGPAPGSDAMLRSAVVHVARHFLQLAQTRSPAEMEAMIWRYASTDGADHGPSCAAFASLTLELGSQLAGHESWVTGGMSYPWAVHPWVDGRVDPNPASPGIVSVLQDAQAHGRWRPLGDGYTPQPGDWVLFDGHVEVVTKYFGGVLHTIGGDSMPNLSVNVHEYAGPLKDQGVAGFVDNGLSESAPPGRAGHNGRAAKGRGTSHRATAATDPQLQRVLAPRAIPAPRTVPRPPYGPQSRALPAQRAQPGAETGHATVAAAPAGNSAWVASHRLRPQAHQRVSPIPGTGARYAPHPASQPAHRPAQRGAGKAHVPATGMRPATAKGARPGEAAIPGLFKKAHRRADAATLPPYHRHNVTSAPAVPVTAAQQAFIREVAQGAMATQREYGVPASVTIAQAIDESAWGQSTLAVNDHNLFGIKGTGPAGSDVLPTQEVIGGQVINTSAPFRIYQSVAQSIDAHAKLLAHSSYYTAAMSQRHDPNAFANALTGVYATDPAYGARLIQLMQRYDLYRYDQAAAAGAGSSGTGQHKVHAGHWPHQAGTSQPGSIWAPGQTPIAGTPADPAPASSAGSPAQLPQPGPIWAPGQAEAPEGLAGPAQPPQPAGPSGSSQPAPIWAPGQTPGSGHATVPPTPARAPHTPAHALVARHTWAIAQAHPAQPNPVANPAPAPYPGRSPRPAPLRHPARPADPAYGSVLGHAPELGTVQHPEHGGAHHTASDSAPAGHTAGKPGSGSGLASGAADAAIPGLPAAPAPRVRHAHSRTGIGRLRPGHPAVTVRPARRASGATGAGNNAPRAAGPQGVTWPPSHSQLTTSGAGRPAHTSAPLAENGTIAITPAIPGIMQPEPGPSVAAATPAAAEPAAPPPGGAAIPGLGHGAPPAHGAPRAASAQVQLARGGTAAATAAGGSSIPGAQQADGAGVVTDQAISMANGTAAAIPAAGSDVPGAQPPGAARRANAAARPTIPSTPATGNPSRGNRVPTGTVASGGARGAQHGSGAGAGNAPARPTGHTSGAHGAAPARPAPGWSRTTGRAGRAAPDAGITAPDATRSGRDAGITAPDATRSGRDAARSGHGAPVSGTAAGVPSAVSASPMAGASSATRRAPRPGAGTAKGGTTNAGTTNAGTTNAGTTNAGTPSTGTPSTEPTHAMLTAYHPHLPPAVREAFVTSARMPLRRAEPLYADVASHTGIRWEILAACDWMQCKARRGVSPVYGEKLGALNEDGTCYRTKSAALERCAYDLVQLAWQVYRLDIATSQELSVRDLANVFAAYRWGSLLRQHSTSALDFPYSVAGLTADHTHMRWPNIDAPDAPDKPGSRFRDPFGAVPVVLSLSYQALA